MSSKLKEYYHVFDAWDIYPRVNYFQRRYKDVFLRFEKLLENMPYTQLFDSQAVIEKLEEFGKHLEGHLEVTVLGKSDLPIKTFVVHDKPSHGAKMKRNLKGKPALKGTGKGINVVICNILVDDIREKAMKNTIKAISAAVSENVLPTQNGTFFVYCQFSKDLVSKESRQQFREYVIQGLQQKTGKYFEDCNFITDTESVILSSKISYTLEKMIAENLVLMKWHLQNFTRSLKGVPEDDILERKEFMSIIQGFLRNGLGFVDMLEDTGDKTFKELVFNKLGRIVRCSVVDLLASKYGVSQDMCNQIAHQVNFEDEVKKCISKNTTYHLSKLEQPCKDYVAAVKSGNSFFVFQGFRFVFIAYQIRDDVKKVVQVLEKAVEVLCDYSRKLRSVIFEQDGYLGQSIADVGNIKPIVPVITQKLRTDILSLEFVYGMGTICGEVEIHLQKGTRKENACERIKEVMKLNKFSHPYHLKTVIQEPIPLAVDHGHEIKLVDKPKGLGIDSGTLGCFVKKDGDKLYAVTSAHVVSTADVNEHPVQYRRDQEIHGTFATSDPRLIIPQPYNPDAAIDIAAVKVNKDIEPECITSMRDEDNELQEWILLTENETQDLYPFVYKHGAGTEMKMNEDPNLTLPKGIVYSNDFVIKTDPDREFLSLITPQEDVIEGDVEPMYAWPGDSGAVNCVPNFDDPMHPIKAVSMVSKGQYKVEGHPIFCMSFRLDEGLRRLNLI